MKPKTPLITDPFDLQRKTLDHGEAFPEHKWKSVFYENGELNTFNLFIAHFDTIPFMAYAYDLDCKKANAWFLSKYAKQVRFYYQRLTSVYDRGVPRNEDNHYIIFEDLIISIDTHSDFLQLCYRLTDLQKVNEILTGFRRFLKANNHIEPRIAVLVNGKEGLHLKKMMISKSGMSLTDNYNDDFTDIHRIITSRLRKKSDSGLVILHGKPGTGKTYYIRHLTTTIKKNIIFLPPHLADAITNPDLIGILIDNPDSILVIEDAENIMVDRETRKGSPVSTILNITDGLLSDFLNIQIICSFNTDISNIDAALTRKGRLIAQYEFRELTVEKFRALSDKLGFKSEIDTPMTLTSIYNQNERDCQPVVRKRIGFQV